MLNTYEEVSSFINAFEACRLPKTSWTHEAHLIAGFWYARNHENGAALAVIRERIRRHNESVGTENTDSGGYHETITRLYMTAIAQHVALSRHLTFEQSLNALLSSPLGDSAWPLGYYSKELLFSVVARREWVEPDLRSLEELTMRHGAR